MSHKLLWFTGGGGPPVTPFDQTITSPGPTRTPIMGAALFTQPGTVTPPLVCKVFARSDLVTPIVVLDNSHDRTFQDQLNDVGSGSLILDNDDPDLADIPDQEHVIGWEIYGWRILTTLARSFQRTSLTQNEEHDENTIISGPGHLSILDESTVYPSRGVGKSPVEEDRNFSWPSPDYNDAGWRTATSIVDVADANGSGGSAWPLQPFGGDSDFAFEFTDIIGPSTGTNLFAPVGTCYLRGHHTFAAGAYIVYLAADNVGDFYIDGQGFAHSEDFTHTTNIIVDFDAGSHVFAASIINVAQPPAQADNPNPIGLAVSVWTCDANGTPLTHVWSTDDTWLIVEYPATPPGMTPGEAIHHAVSESQARGELLEISLGFTDETDSNGAPWPVVTDISTKVGNDLLTFLKELAGTYVDFWMEPGTWTLHAYNIGTLGQTRSVALEAGGDLTELIHNSQAVQANVFLVRWGDNNGGTGGWLEAGTVPDGQVRRCALLSLGAAASADQALYIALQQLAKYGQIRQAIQATYDIGLVDGVPDVSIIPGVAYLVGDTITVPEADATPGAERVLSVSVSEDDEGVLSITPELRDIFLDAEQRYEQQIKMMGGGTMRGDSQVATPIGLIPAAGPTCCPQVPSGGGG